MPTIYVPKTPTSDNPFENLANAVILQAVADYRSALKTLKKSPWNHIALSNKRSLEYFFRSKWFSTLTITNGIDGDWLVRKLREEVNK